MYHWNGTINVSRDTKGQYGYVSLPVDRLLFFRANKKLLEVHTASDLFYIDCCNFKMLQTAMWTHGYHFIKSDRGDIPDITKIKLFDRDWSRAYFVDRPDHQSKYVHIAKHRFDDFVKYTAKYNLNIMAKIDNRS